MQWQPSDGLTIKARMSLVCRNINNDFDPGRAAEACKFYPELTLSWSSRDSKVPRVKRLHGTVCILANNRMLPGAHHGGDGGGMVPNSQTVALVADSNTSKSFSRYSVQFAPAPGPIPVPVPVKGDWQAGRLLGHLDSPRGVGPWLLWQKIDQQPLLPEWSWLFDYGRIVEPGADVTEVVAWENNSPRGIRERPGDAPWPPNPDPGLPGKPSIHVVKFPRQGAYDNLHVMANMGNDTEGRPMVAAPFCADLCLHLHFRWGKHAVEPAEDPVPFLGWSSGPHAAAHSSIGAPLVPPNQRITLNVHRVDAEQTQIRYAAEIDIPREGRNQVILEQGLGFAFTYGGLRLRDRVGLSAAYARFSSPLVATGFALGTSDAMTREFFRGVYEKIRWLSYGFEGSDQPQQIPTEHLDGPTGVGSPLFRGFVDL